MDYAAEYGRLHANDKYFPGSSIRPHVQTIARLVDRHRPDRLLDFGCGKGMQYLAERVHDDWGGLLPHCYDIAVRQLAKRPEGRFGGVICTDVLEHIETPDVPAFLDDLISFVDDDGFLFVSISCIPAKNKTLSDGRNVHVTLKPPEWWMSELAQARDRRQFFGGIEVWASFETADAPRELRQLEARS